MNTEDDGPWNKTLKKFKNFDKDDFGFLLIIAMFIFSFGMFAGKHLA